jgi:hypothetical protein
MSWAVEDQLSAKTSDISLFHSVQTGYETHQASCLKSTENYFPGGKAAGERISPFNSI